MRTIQELVQLLSVSPESGLSPKRVEESQQSFGTNRLTPLPREPLWKKFLEKFDEPIIKILLAAALLSMIVDLFKPPLETVRYVAGGVAIVLALLAVLIAWALGRKEWVPSVLFAAALLIWPVGLITGHASFDGLAVMLAVILATGVAFLSEYKSDREFELLNARKESQAKVIRDGEFRTLPIEELVVGDIVTLEMGDEVAADGRLIKSTELYIDQSLMTGESAPVHKHPLPVDDAAEGPEQPGCLYRGTQVVDGVGQMMVTEVGDATYLGKIARRLSIEEDEEEPTAQGEEGRVKRKLTISKELTPLQQKLEHLAGLISKVGYVAAVLIFLALVIRGVMVGELRWPRAAAGASAPPSKESEGAGKVANLTASSSSATTFSADGRFLAVTVGNLVTVRDVTTGKSFIGIEAPDKDVYAVALSPDGSRLAMASGDGRMIQNVTIFDPKTGDKITSMEGTWDRQMTFRPDLKQLAAVNAKNQGLEIWDIEQKKVLRSLHQKAHQYTRLVYSPNGQLLAATDFQNNQHHVSIWGPENGKKIADFPKHRELIRDVIFSPDGQQVAESGAGAIWIREATTGKELVTIRGPEESFIDSLSFGAKGTRIAGAIIVIKSGESRAVIWNAQTGEEVASVPQANGPLALSPDGRFFVANATVVVANTPIKSARLYPLQESGQAVVAAQSTEEEFWPVLLESGGYLLQYFMYMVIIIVVAVPEGLPMSVTVSLALAMRKMTRANSLVRQLVACETIGSATVICSDKTGTLTQNKMQVVRLAVDGQIHNRGTETWVLPDAKQAWPREARPMDWIALNSAVNSTANLEEKEGQLFPVGNSTEASLLQWLHESGLEYDQLRRQFPPLYQIHFSSDRKRMTTVIRYGKQLVALIKGAPELVLEQSTHYESADGTVKELTPDLREAELAKLKASAAQAMRTLAFGHGFLPEDTPTDEDSLHNRRETIESKLIYVGFVAIRDPLRADVKDAVAECRKAGIEVVMITGDNVETARAIGHEIDLVETIDASIDATDGVILTSKKFNDLSDDELKALLPQLRIVARARPLDKFRLVRLFQEREEVVAVTGDGTNDAPALKKADVGLAMGRSGTEVAKEASKIVLLDDAFSTIVNAVHWGRSLYENIQRFIQFQLTINVSALVIAFLGPFFGVKPPFTILQLLWINVIMDTFASIALCSEPPRPGLMDVPPKRRHESILTRSMLITIFTTAGFFVVVMMCLLVGMAQGWWLTGPESERSKDFPELTVWQVSVFFTVYVLFQVWNEINCRTLVPEVSGLRGLFQNSTFLAIVGLTVIGQVVIVTFGGAIFKVGPLRLIDWLAIAGGTASVLVFAEIVRRVRLLVASSHARPRLVAQQESH